ncbi:hypothetical protein CMI37_22895 [Candidatus Pacearchaeota archaeon]|nr:hypothetical protein [Candidatus Pacearchaeota archaeon]|tara:strand:+ start:983 stop:1366 length:384 start_codon:yes stop_codon:yes gene_type:complete
MNKSFNDNWDKYQVDLVPIEYKVIVLPDKVEETLGEEGLIISPETVQDQDQRAQVRATIIAISDMAFTLPMADGGVTLWPGYIPKVGDRAYYGKYAGIITDEKDENGVSFVVINDKDIAAIIKRKEK